MGSGLVRLGGAAGLPGFIGGFGLAMMFIFGLDATLFIRGQPGVGIQRPPFACWYLSPGPLLLVASPDPVAVRRALSLAERSRPLRQSPASAGRPVCERNRLQFSGLAFSSFGSLTSSLMFRRVWCLDLRAIQGATWPEVEPPCRSRTGFETGRNSGTKRLQNALREGR